MKKAIRLISSILLCVISTSVLAQETPFLNNRERMLLINELSGDRSFEHIRVLSQWHRGSGMDGYFKAADYMVEQAKKVGLVDVKFVEQKLERDNYTPISAELWVTDPVEYKLADMGDHALFLSDGSHSADIEQTELVFVGDGSKETVKDIDVKGKIVLTNIRPGAAVKNAVYEKGALGGICYPTSESRSHMDFPDQLAWTRISSNIPAGKQGTFSFNIPPRRGEMLREMLESDKEKDFFRIGKKVQGGKIVVKAKVVFIELLFDDNVLTTYVKKETVSDNFWKLS